MKGIVFTEFLDFVEGATSDDVVDAMIERADLPSGGVYTAVGKYDYKEIVALVVALSEITEIPVPDLVRAFGENLFGRFAAQYPEFFVDQTDAFEFICSVEERIHVEVLKLYPDAELPTLDAERVGADRLSLRYSSCRPFGELCIGLLRGCAEHFGESFETSHTATEDGLLIEVRRVAAQAA